MVILERAKKIIAIIGVVVFATIVFEQKNAILRTISSDSVSLDYLTSTIFVHTGLAAFCDVDSAKITSNKRSYSALLASKVLHENNHALQRKFEQSLEQLQKSSDFGEVVLQKIIDLLDCELKIVRLIFYGHIGSSVDFALLERNRILRHTVPSVAFMYDTILDLATYDYHRSRKLVENTKKKKPLSVSLTYQEKKDFLQRMELKLERYQGILIRLQCTLAQRSATSIDSITIDSHGNTLYYCPKVR